MRLERLCRRRGGGSSSSSSSISSSSSSRVSAVNVLGNLST